MLLDGITEYIDLILNNQNHYYKYFNVDKYSKERIFSELSDIKFKMKKEIMKK
jgi:hypothetical protein